MEHLELDATYSRSYNGNWNSFAQYVSTQRTLCRVWSIKEMGYEMCMDENLFGLMTSLLHPSRQYFRQLRECPPNDCWDEWFGLVGHNNYAYFGRRSRQLFGRCPQLVLTRLHF